MFKIYKGFSTPDLVPDFFPPYEFGRAAVDLCDELAAYLKAYIGDRKSGLLFQTESGLPIAQSNIIRSSLKSLGVSGFHTFRRFRVSQFDEADCPEDLKKYWTGHATKGVTELYARQTTKNLKRRKDWAERIGPGFALDWSPNCSIAPQCTPGVVANAA